MNPIVEEMLMHYGMPKRSGRYPYGSGDNPYQHSGDFLSRVEEMKKNNFIFTDKDGKTYTGEVAIAKSMGLSTTQFRTQMSLAKDERRSLDVATAKSLREKGYSLNEIADKMGFANDSSVRSLLNENSEARMLLTIRMVKLWLWFATLMVELLKSLFLPLITNRLKLVVFLATHRKMRLASTKKLLIDHAVESFRQ